MRWTAVTHERAMLCLRARRLAIRACPLHVDDNRDLESTFRVREPWSVTRRGGTLERCKPSDKELRGAADPVGLVRV